MSKERRHAPRVPLEGSVVVFSGNERLSCRLLDISQSGLALAADAEQRPGTFLRLQFTLPGDDRPTGADAVVVRHRASGSKVKWGVQLVDPPPELTARLRQLEADELGIALLPEADASPSAETGIALLDEADEDPMVQKLRRLYERTRATSDE